MSRRIKSLTYAGVIITVGVLANAQDARDRQASRSTAQTIRKPEMSDTIKANIYADNWFMLYVNGELVAVDSIRFLPHNVVAVDLLPSYPMTIAVIAKDNADPKTGMEYANTHIGDGGFILKFGDGTVTDKTWKTKCVSRGPIGRDVNSPTVENTPIPQNWYAVAFDDGAWDYAVEFTEQQVNPKKPFYDFDFQGAKFIWSGDLDVDNTILFRKVVQSPPDGKLRPDFSKLNDLVPDEPAGRAKRQGRAR